MKFEDVKDLSQIELKKRINQRKNELFQLKMKNHMGELGSPIEIRNARKDIAKMLTAFGQSQAAESKES
jgi:large subunit ribosomal protein L29